MTDPAAGEFPDVPENLFDGVDIGKLTEAMAEQQFNFFDRTLSDEALNTLGVAVDGWEAAAERRDKIIALVSFYGGLGLRLVSVVL